MPVRLSVLRSFVAVPRLVGLAFALAAALAAFAGATVAAQRGPGTRVPPPEPDVYQGCVNVRTGVLRIVTSTKPTQSPILCAAHETLIQLGSSSSDAALLQRIEKLEADNAAQNQVITTLQDELDVLQAQVPDCLSTEGTEVYFTGCNVNIRSGSGSTYGEINSLGNLIIGYNEDDSEDKRTGSHNLVIGPYHEYTSYGGLVVGDNNTVSGQFSSVSGGYGNTASGNFSSVSGGEDNTASGPYSSVSGGNVNTASGNYSSVSGGLTNTASGLRSSVSGGYSNTASNKTSSISGGNSNTASGESSSVGGGLANTASGLYSSVGGGTGLEANEENEFEPSNRVTIS